MLPDITPPPPSLPKPDTDSSTFRPSKASFPIPSLSWEFGTATVVSSSMFRFASLCTRSWRSSPSRSFRLALNLSRYAVLPSYFCSLTTTHFLDPSACFLTDRPPYPQSFPRATKLLTYSTYFTSKPQSCPFDRICLSVKISPHHRFNDFPSYQASE
jgi:hypothetical protein